MNDTKYKTRFIEIYNNGQNRYIKLNDKLL